MVLDQLTGIGFQWVEQSWLLSTLAVKYLVIAIGAETLVENADLEHFLNLLKDYSENLIILVTSLGLLNVFIGYEITPLFPVFSQVIALLYYIYLFWSF